MTGSGSQRYSYGGLGGDTSPSVRILAVGHPISPMPGALSIRHNACYVAWEGMWRAEAGMEETPHYGRVVVIVFVDDFDPSTIAALRYARSLRPSTMRAVHFVIDSQQAERLRAAWLPDRGVSLEFVDCPDRRLTRCAADLVRHEAESLGAQVTVILPGRSFSPRLGRLLHGRTADKIAGVVSRVPNVAVTIIPSSSAA
jgi:hypothetical protein